MPFWLQPQVHKQTCYKWPHHCQEKKRWQPWDYMEELRQVVCSSACHSSLSYRLCKLFSQRTNAFHKKHLLIRFSMTIKAKSKYKALTIPILANSRTKPLQ